MTPMNSLFRPFFASFASKSSAIKLTVALASLFFCSVSFVGCQTNEKGNSSAFKIVATTGHVNDALVAITEGTDVQIKLLCGPGVDPHSFSASTKDSIAMENADMIVFNGFHLEAKLHTLLHDTFKDKSHSMDQWFPKDQRIQWVEEGKVDPEAPFDPHIWNHLPGWIKCVQELGEKLAELNPKNAETYKNNTTLYVKKLEDLHQWAKKELESIPAQNRTLVSTHDAFNYFANQYNLKAEAVLGIGNDAEASVKEMAKVAKKICELKVPVIFMESITNPKVTTALKEACRSQGWKVEIANQRLFSDDIGEKAPQNTFMGAFRSNVELIASSLKGSKE